MSGPTGEVPGPTGEMSGRTGEVSSHRSVHRYSPRGRFTCDRGIGTMRRAALGIGCALRWVTLATGSAPFVVERVVQGIVSVAAFAVPMTSRLHAGRPRGASDAIGVYAR